MAHVKQAVATILAKRQAVSQRQSVLVGITGIDASGKGYLAAQIVACLQQQGVKAIGIHADDWLNLPQTRFAKDNPAEHFYTHTIRFEEMFQHLTWLF